MYCQDPIHPFFFHWEEMKHLTLSLNFLLMFPSSRIPQNTWFAKSWWQILALSTSHSCQTPSSSCTLWFKPTLTLPSKCRGKTLLWSFLVGFSTSAPQPCCFLLRSQCDISLLHNLFLLPTHHWDSYIPFNTMQLCTLRGKETIIWHTGAINYFKFIFLCECFFFVCLFVYHDSRVRSLCKYTWSYF